MAHPVSNQNTEYTYSDDLTWPEDERWELINGTARNMASSPPVVHQEVLTDLATQLIGPPADSPKAV